MENDIELPKEYFANNSEELLKEDISNDDLLTLDVVMPTLKEEKENIDTQENKLPFLNIPEKQLTQSTEIAPGLVPETTTAPSAQSSDIPFSPKPVVYSEPQQQSLIQPIVEKEQSRPVLDDKVILDEISKIDDKINSLETELKNITLEEKNNFNSVVNENDNTISDFNTDNTDVENVVEVYSNKNNIQKQYIQRDINLLRKQKTKLLNEQQKRVNAPKPIIDNTEFVPNFSPETVENKNNEALNRSLEVEEFLGEGNDSPKVVNDPSLGTAVISESQGTLENAIQDHGGIENALKDSVNNQNNYTQITPNVDTAPDNSAAVASNTQKILEAVTAISSQLKEIAGSLKGGNQQNSNSKKSATTQQQNDNVITSPSIPQQGSAGGGSKKDFEPIKNLKGDLPNPSDFPSDFDLTQLKGSNLLTRI